MQTPTRLEADQLYAVVKTFNAGYQIERDSMESKFTLGQHIPVDRIEIGRSSTNVYLIDHDHSFNSVFFDFVYNGLTYDVFSNPEKLSNVINMYGFFKLK